MNEKSGKLLLEGVENHKLAPLSSDLLVLWRPRPKKHEKAWSVASDEMRGKSGNA